MRKALSLTLFFFTSTQNTFAVDSLLFVFFFLLHMSTPLSALQSSVPIWQWHFAGPSHRSAVRTIQSASYDEMDLQNMGSIFQIWPLDFNQANIDETKLGHTEYKDQGLKCSLPIKDLNLQLFWYHVVFLHNCDEYLLTLIASWTQPFRKAVRLAKIVGLNRPFQFS